MELFWPHIFVSLATLIPLINGFSVESHIKGYGEACNQIEKCNYRHWLKCRNGFCECLNGSAMIYQEDVTWSDLGFFANRLDLMKSRSCRARVNQNCVPKFFIDDEDQGVRAPPLSELQDGSSPKQTQLCVSNAYCHPHGICKCRENFAANATSGSCQKLREFSEKCYQHSDCHPDRFLKCRGGTCQCDLTSKYDERLGKCTVGPKETCFLGFAKWTHKQVDNCVSNSTCHLSQCECHHGFKADFREKMCERDYNYFCDTVRSCANEEENSITRSYNLLECVNNSCVCKGDIAKPIFYRSKFQACVSLNRGNPRNPPLILLELFFVMVVHLIMQNSNEDPLPMHN